MAAVTIFPGSLPTPVMPPGSSSKGSGPPDSPKKTRQNPLQVDNKRTAHPLASSWSAASKAENAGEHAKLCPGKLGHDFDPNDPASLRLMLGATPSWGSSWMHRLDIIASTAPLPEEGLAMF